MGTMILSIILLYLSIFHPFVSGVKIEELIPLMVAKHFQNCSVILTYNTEEDNGSFLVKAQGILLNLARIHDHDTYLIDFSTFIPTGGAFPSRLGSVHKLRPNCVFSIILIEKVESVTFHQLFDLLIPRNLEVSKKDEDYYLIYSKAMDVNKILLSDMFSMKIKYKLLLTQDNEDEDILSSYSLCFYCKNGKYGKQEVVQLDLNFTKDELPEKDELFPDFVRQFNGAEMRVVVATGTHQQARIRPVQGNPNLYEKWRGSYFYVLDELTEIFNFTYSVRPSAGGGTGLVLPNKTWVGTTGDVYNNFADIGLVTAVTYQRYKYISYSYSLSWEWLTFATAIPKAQLSWQAIFWPYDQSLWFYVLGAMIFTIFGMWFIQSFLSRWGVKRKCWTATEFVFGTFIEQSFNMPEKTGLRIIITVWLAFGIILGTGYKSKLVTALAFPVYNQPPQTFSQLAFSGYKVGLCYVGGAAYAVFKSSNNPTYVKLANAMELFNDMTDCFVSTLEGNRGCIGYDSMANYVLAKNLTDRKGRKLIVVTAASTFFVACGFVITKRAIFRLNWDAYIMTWDDMAIITKWRAMDFESVRKERFQWEMKENIKSIEVDVSEGPQKLQIGNLKAVFYFLLFGIILGGIAFTVEALKQRFLGFMNGTTTTKIRNHRQVNRKTVVIKPSG